MIALFYFKVAKNEKSIKMNERSFSYTVYIFYRYDKDYYAITHSSMRESEMPEHIFKAIERLMAEEAVTQPFYA